MVCRTSQLAQNCLYLGLNTKNNVCKEQFLKKNPSAAIIRQTYTKVLTAHREIDKGEYSSVQTLNFFFFLMSPINVQKITNAKLT